MTTPRKPITDGKRTPQAKTRSKNRRAARNNKARNHR